MTRGFACPRRAVLLALPALLAGGAVAAEVPARRLAARWNRLGAGMLASQAAGGSGALTSALSLLDALAPLGPAARGQAATAFEGMLGPGGGDARALHVALGGSEGLRRATALWLPRPQQPLPTYREAIAPLGTQVEPLDFAAPEALLRVNNWVAERTGNLIPALLDRLPRYPGLLVTAALHFAARWSAPFDPTMTQPGQFIRGDGQRVDASFMRTVQTLPYAESRLWQAVRLPYAGEAFEALVMVPAPGRFAGQVAEAVRGRHALPALEALRFAPTEVDLSLPRLAIDLSSDWLAHLRQGSLAPALGPEADLRGMTGNPLRLTAIRQRVLLRVNEEGTEAAAATAVLGDRSLRHRARLSADRSFLFFVVHRPTGLHLVSALVNEPGGS